MTAQHTPGRLNVGTPPPNGEQTIGTELGRMVAVATTEANARRLVACWNYCDGVSTERLEKYGMPDSAQKASDLREQRDELRAALKQLYERPEHTSSWLQARAAIAKATGGAE